MRLTVTQAFELFDTDGSGEISASEFMGILRRVCGAGHEAEKQELIEFILRSATDSATGV
jgi:Ca2+-binding EF-hand superfamily protein